MDKQKIRENIVSIMTRLAPEEKLKIETQLIAHLIQSSLWKKANIIGVTSSTSIEWNTTQIIEKAWSENKNIVIPKSLPETKQLIYYKINSYSQLERGYANILEPIPTETKKIDAPKIDLLIVPGLAFDKRGYRIGFGGGYYDRFLEKFTLITVSLASELQIVKEIPINEFDIPVQYLVTENSIIKTKLNH